MILLVIFSCLIIDTHLHLIFIIIVINVCSYIVYASSRVIPKTNCERFDDTMCQNLFLSSLRSYMCGVE